MLEAILRHLNNIFATNSETGDFAVEDGYIALPSLLDGQFYWISGSVFNDGLHRYGEANLTDETFSGTIYALAIPADVLELAEEIETWQDKNGDSAASPYQSESFGGYSYSKGSGESTVTWQSVFKARLSPYRRIRGL